MNLKLVRRHLSLKVLSSTNLPSFVVLTGVNGAGKTHLLQAIVAGSVVADCAPDYRTQARYYDYSSFASRDPGDSHTHQLYAERDAILENVRNVRAEFLERMNAEIAVLRPEQWDGDVWEFAGLALPDVLSRCGDDSLGKRLYSHVARLVQEASANLMQGLGKNSPHSRLAAALAAKHNGHAILVNARDFKGDNFGWGDTNFLQHSFGRLFLAYFELQKLNGLYAMNRNAGRTSSQEALDEAAFRAKWGDPPWELVNRTLESARLPFRIDYPVDWETTQYTPTLHKLGSGATMLFSALSSGEKVLMALALCLYYSGDRRQMMERPKLLLLDEIDAPLHPSMARQLVQTVETTLVGQEGMSVIMTTHSPSTIAVCPEESVFVMRPDEPGIHKVTRSQALAILTADLPILSMSFDGRRQVFVESDLDAERYELLSQALRGHLLSERSLVFIGVGRRPTSGADQGAGSAQVERVVQGLVDGGNVTVFGLLDWDAKRKSTPRLHVLGEGERYAIENCLLDPLLLAATVLRESQSHAAAFGLDRHCTYVGFCSLDLPALQVAVDVVQRAVLGGQVLVPAVQVKYIGGFSLSVSEAYLRHNGHTLEEAVDRAFPVLRKFHQTGALLKHIAATIVRDVPRYAPDSLRGAMQGLLDATV